MQWLANIKRNAERHVSAPFYAFNPIGIDISRLCGDDMTSSAVSEPDADLIRCSTVEDEGGGGAVAVDGSESREERLILSRVKPVPDVIW